jgi:endonuclease-3
MEDLMLDDAAFAAFLDWDMAIVDPDNPLEDPDYIPGPSAMRIHDNESISDVDMGDYAELVETEIRGAPRVTFLDLPEDIKIKILEYAGLLQPDLIDVSFENVRFNQGLVSYRRPPPTRMAKGQFHTYLLPPRHVGQNLDPLPVGVFLASKAAREELGRLFFSRNQFSVFLHHKSNYKIFCNSFGWGFEHLRYLYVDLGPREHRSLRMGPGVHRTVMRLWADFCKKAAENMPNLVDFSLKCRVKDLEVATKLISAMDPFPPLVRCAIWLNHQQDDDIYPVVRRAVWRLTDNLDKPSFPFSRLPKEVQLIILENLLGNSHDPYIQPRKDLKNTHGVVTFQDRRRHRTSNLCLTCCGTCSPMRAMCFCSTRQTAFSTTCSCFTPPVNYFLVSRGFYEDARRVFFSQNTFAFVDGNPDSMMRILHYIPTASFAYMGHLTFKFPFAWCARYTRPDDEVLVSWAILRRFIREHFDISRLSVTIVDLSQKNPYSTASHRLMRTLVKSFSDLRGLRDFRVYLASDRAFEKEAESAVMGPCADRSIIRSLPFIGEKPSPSSSTN